MSAKNLAKNSFVQALVGNKKDANLLEKIANKYSDEPYLWAFKEVEEPQSEWEWT